MKLDELALDSGPTAYYTDTFRRALDDQLVLLRNADSTQVSAIDPILAHRFEGDLYGLLSALRIPPHLHYVVTRVNQLRDRFDVPSDLSVLLIPDPGYIDQLRQQLSVTQ